MRRTDGQVGSNLKAMTVPIRRTAWRVVDSPDVRPEVCDFVRTALGLDERGAGRQRRRRLGVSWDAFLQHALLMLPFGHSFFVPVFEIGPPQPGSTLPQGTYAHLARLDPRMPRTLTGIHIESDDLTGITQMMVTSDGKASEVFIPRERLIPVINDREGSDWTGSSVLRTAYKHFVLKEMLERLGAQTVERNGMGVPVVEFPPDGDRGLALSLATQIRAGEQAGVALPLGYKLTLQGVTGMVVDPLPQIEYHSQAIGRAVLAMFLNLGTGSSSAARALGETFVDFFTISLNAIIANLEEVATEEISRRIVDLNFGESEPYPEIVAEELHPGSPVTAEAVATLVTAGVLTPDDVLEADVRRKFGLPPAAPAAEEAIEVQPDPTSSTVDVKTGMAGASGRLSAVSGTIDEIRDRLAKLRRGKGVKP